MENSHTKSTSKTDALSEKFEINIQEISSDKHPLVFYDPQIGPQKRKMFTEFLQKKGNFYCFSQFDEILKFAESNPTSFMMIIPNQYNDRKLFQSFKDIEMQRFSEFEETSFWKDFIKEMPDQILNCSELSVFHMLKVFPN